MPAFARSLEGRLPNSDDTVTASIKKLLLLRRN